ncbi:MAG: hypothetical protein CBB92_00115 [Flammeovirgaceae bacterium TMED32]|nr:MAG: hypothetical protein CBB92_00115 [Flammeovirgaceae bacterium TMED32]
MAGPADSTPQFDQSAGKHFGDSAKRKGQRSEGVFGEEGKARDHLSPGLRAIRGTPASEVHAKQTHQIIWACRPWELHLFVKILTPFTLWPRIQKPRREIWTQANSKCAMKFI